ncbi:MAG: response regulator [Treponema sp.]|jgi:two-component system response regulator YesN|nr:response regulator [Treponema sp.]
MDDYLYTFILVDDEPEIREGIRDSIPWEELGFSFAGACADGYEALELAERIQPDAVLTDINMPFLDGLSFTDRLLTAAPGAKVLIISGYDDFEYARRALQLQVYDYIVKPVTPGELRGILEKLRAALDRDREERLNMNHIKEQLARSIPLLRERFLARLVEGKLEGEAIRERIRYFGLSLPVENTSYQCLILDFVRRRGGEDFDIDLLAQRNILEKSLNDCDDDKTAGISTDLLFRDRDDRLALLLWGGDGVRLYRKGLRVAESLCRDLGTAGFKGTVIGVGEAAADIKGIPRSYDTAVDVLTAAALRGKSGVTAYRELVGKTGVSREEETASRWDRRIYSALKAGDNESAGQCIGEMVRSFRDISFSLEFYHRKITLVLAALIQFCTDLEIPEAAVFPPPSNPFAEIAALENLEDVESRLTGFLERIVQYAEARQDNFAQVKVKEALDYLESHYADPGLSLRGLCKTIDISMSYFSAVLKKYHDRTFVEELTAIRLNRAMELLRTTDMLTYEIAEKIGYRDAHYFSLSFRKYTGMTTTEYRNSLRGGARNRSPNAPAS